MRVKALLTAGALLVSLSSTHAQTRSTDNTQMLAMEDNEFAGCVDQVIDTATMLKNTVPGIREYIVSWGRMCIDTYYHSLIRYGLTNDEAAKHGKTVLDAVIARHEP